MTALERIEEIKNIDTSGTFPRRWCNENLQGDPKLMQKDILFLLKVFELYRKLAIDKLEDVGWLGDLDSCFEEEMSK